MSQGKPVDGFTGALPASQVKAFLDKHLPSEGELEAVAEADQAHELLEAGDTEAALAKLADALAADPGNDDTRYDYIKLLIELGQLTEAGALLEPKLKEIPRQLRFDALAWWMGAMMFVASSPYAAWTVAQFDEKIALNKRDFDMRFAKARLLMALSHWTAAMDELLEIIMRDKKWQDEAPRKAFVAILELLTPPKPKASAQTPGKTAGGIEVLGKAAVQEDPQAALVSSYRRKLSMALN
jgi:putative thioredoxin